MRRGLSWGTECATASSRDNLQVKVGNNAQVVMQGGLFAVALYRFSFGECKHNQSNQRIIITRESVNGHIHSQDKIFSVLHGKVVPSEKAQVCRKSKGCVMVCCQLIAASR